MRISFQNSWLYLVLAGFILASVGITAVLRSMENDQQLKHHSSIGESIRQHSHDPVTHLGQAAAVAGQKKTDQPTSPFAVDEKDNLVIDDNTGIILEAFLAGLPPDVTSAELNTLKAQTLAGLPSQAAAKASFLIDAYMKYRHAQNELSQQPEPQNLTEEQQVLAALMTLRRHYFDRDSADAIFGTEEARQLYGLQVARIAADNQLSDATKAQQIKDLHAALAPQVAALEFNPADQFSPELEMRIAELRRRHIAEEEIRRLRYRHFGMEVPTESLAHH